jgi:hypothetical protein
MRPDRVMWTVGLTLAGAVLAGLVLNLTVGLSRTGWLIALGAVAACAAGAGLALRKHRARRVPAAFVPASGFRFSRPTAGYLLLAAVLAGGAVWLGAASAGWQRSHGFAQLWLTPSNETSATLGVRNDYAQTEQFRLVLKNAQGTTASWNLNLAAGATWQRTVAAPDGSSTLSAQLTTAGQDRVLEAGS